MAEGDALREIRGGKPSSALAAAVEKSMGSRGDKDTAGKLKILIGSIITEMKIELDGGHAERLVTLAKSIEPLARSMVVLGGPQDDELSISESAVTREFDAVEEQPRR